MKKFIFPYSISFGKNDNIDLEIEIDLSDNDSQRLFEAATSDKRMRFRDNASVEDIYEEVDSAVIELIRKGIDDDPSPVVDMLSWEDEDYDPDQPITEDQIEQYLEELYITIYYPTELVD